MFIVFEGVDGSGKTTQAMLFHESLLNEGIDAVLTREPTDGPVGKLIRERIRDGDTDPAVLSRLFAADRRDHVAKLVLPALAAGKVVVSDRYLPSSLAYQSDSVLSASDVLILNQQGVDLPVPDLVVQITVGFDTLLKRIEARGGQDSFENLDKQRKVQEGYEMAWRLLEWPVERIPGDGSIEDVFKLIRAAWVRKAG